MSEGAESKRLLHQAQQLLAQSADGLTAFDRAFRYIYWSPAMERISGMKSADVLGKQAFELFPFLLENGADTLWKKVLDGASISVEDLPFFIAATQRSGYYDARYSPLQSEAGEIVGGIGVIRDITEQKRAQQQISETESRFQNMANVSPVMLWMSGTDALCNFFNQTWLDFTGRTLEQEWGVGWAESVHFEDIQRCLDTYMAAFSQRQVFEMEYRLRRADGEHRWILDRGTPRFSPNGSFAGYIGSCVDITDFKNMETDLRQAVRARDEFLTIASHELRTPLTSLQLQIESLSRTLRKNPELGIKNGRVLQNAENAKKQIDRLTDLITVLLDISRISEGRLTFDYQEVDLSTVVADLVERFKEPSREAGSALTFQSLGAITGRWDRVRVEQVVNNLLSNAVKYGSGNPIEVSVGGDGGMALVKVRDHGIGISKESQERIFERFERAVSPRQYGGFGLGLWISRQIVTALGGNIQVDSAPGEGATFVVALPRLPKIGAASMKSVSLQ